MAETRCSACEKVLDVDPVKCPYCEAVQPVDGAPAREAVRRAAALTLGAAIGFLAGFGVLRVPILPSPAVSLSLNVKMGEKASVDEASFRRQARAAVKEIEGEGRRYLAIEEAVVEGASWEGKPAALEGLANWLHLAEKPPYFALCTSWGLGVCIAVDAAALSDEDRRNIQRDHFPPTNYLVRGVLRAGSRPAIPGAAGRWLLEAESVRSYGPSPGGGAKTFRDYLK